MFFDEFKTSRRERNRIKGLPSAEQRTHDMFHDENDHDRRRLVVIGGVILLMAGAVFVVTRENDESNPEPDSQLIPTSTLPVPSVAAIAGGGDCLYDDMTTDPEQTEVLQDFLSDRGYYEGNADGRYDQDVVQAVMAFQTAAHKAGTYKAAIDGQANFFTCMAMGEPYFIQQNN